MAVTGQIKEKEAGPKKCARGDSSDRDPEVEGADGALSIGSVDTLTLTRDLKASMQMGVRV